MLRKIFVLFLAATLCFLCSCAEEIPDATDTTASSVDTTTAQTEGTTETTVLEETTVWEPDLSASWEHAPYYFYKGEEPEINPEDYDIQITVEPNVISMSNFPDEIYIHIENATGKPYIFCLSYYIEKLYGYYKNESYRPLIEEPRLVWIRVPFENSWKIYWVEENEEKRFPLNYDKLTRYDFDFPPGKYRVVFYSAVGTHYGYFEVTE